MKNNIERHNICSKSDLITPPNQIIENISNNIHSIIFPPKLKKGDHIRVIAPARSLKLIGYDGIEGAIRSLEEFGFIVSFGKNVSECDDFMSSSVESRVSDLHEAFSDKDVNGILTVIGGYNSNQLLDYIDYDLIKNNPKILCGFSDITTLSNAIFSQTGVVGYSGPHFSSWGMKKGFEYIKRYFEKCCMQEESFEIKPSIEWSDDLWFMDQENRDFIKNDGFWIINEGDAKGKIIGGHLPCIEGIQGTQYFSGINESIVLFLEIDGEFANELFDRNLQTLIHQKWFYFVKGIIIGRFQKEKNMTKELLEKIIYSKKELLNIPIIANVDFGHTTPFVTFPIGGEVLINTGIKKIINILKH